MNRGRSTIVTDKNRHQKGCQVDSLEDEILKAKMVDVGLDWIGKLSIQPIYRFELQKEEK